MQVFLYIAIFLLIYLILDFLVKNKLFKKQFKYRNNCIKAIRIGLFLVVVMTAVSEMGVDINAFLTSFGITGLAVSLASREVLSNFISGMTIQIYRPFKIGDKITIKGFTGTVIKINIRETIISSDKGNVVIPNRLLLSEPLLIDKESL